MERNGKMKKHYLKYLLALLLFGSNGVVASYIPLNSYEIVLTRTVIGGLFLALVYLPGRQKSPFWKKKKQLFFLCVSGAAMGASWMFLYEAYARIGVSLATLAYYCGPVIVMILAPLVFRERLTIPKAAGFLSVALGMLLVNGFGAIGGGMSWGLLCGILSAVTYAVMVIFNKKAEGIAGLENAMIQLASGCLVVMAFTLSMGAGSFSVPAESIFPILLLGIVNTGAGCYLYFSSIQQLKAQSVSICGYLEPLSALVFSAALLGERLTPGQAVGAALILGGAAFGELYKRRQGSPQKREAL